MAVTRKEFPKGTVFGRLTVIDEAESVVSGGHNRRRFMVSCECGNTRVMLLTSLKASAARDGKHLSGCGQCAPYLRYPKEYSAWHSMKDRCLNPKHARYNDWGGRGIIIEDIFIHDFYAFLHEIGEAPGPEYSLDRENNGKGYITGNLRWATPTEQANNRRL